MSDLVNYQKMDSTMNDTIVTLTEGHDVPPTTDKQDECSKATRRSSFVMATSPRGEDEDDSVFLADDKLVANGKNHNNSEKNLSADIDSNSRQFTDASHLHDRHRDQMPSRQWNNNKPNPHSHHNRNNNFSNVHHADKRNHHRVTTDDEVVLQVIDMSSDPRIHQQPDRPVHKKLSRQVSFKNARAVARQLSTSTRTVARQMSVSARTAFRRRKRREKPYSFFNVGVFACFCCFSPFGLVGMVLSALSDIAYDDGEMEKARRRRIASLVVSVVGIVITLITATVLLFTVAARINT